MRVRIRRFEKLRSAETWYAQPVCPGKVQHRVQKHPAVAPPATSISRHLCRHVGRRFPGQQFLVDGFGAFPVLELNRPHPVSHPLVQFLPDARSLRQPEVGAYAYGKSRHERYVDEQGRLRRRTRLLPQSEWAVLLPDHQHGFINWATYQTNQARIDANVHPQPHQAGGAVREGAALLQGLAICGKCGRHLHTHYRGRNASPGYHCSGKDIVQGRGLYCLNVGGIQIDQAVAEAFLKALTPTAVEATEQAIEQLEADHDAALSQWRLAVERARYEA